MPDRTLEGKVAFVTGGTGGIGRGIAERFLDAGASVMVGSRRAETGAEMLGELGYDDDRLRYLQADVTQQRDVETLVDAAHAWKGHLDIAVLNAGGVGTSMKIVEMTDDEWNHELDLNINHVFWGVRRSLRHMLPAGSGRIITMSSLEGKHAKAGIAGYVANKHAVNGLTKAVAKEVGTDGITVNAICPGLVVTDLIRRGGGKGIGAAGGLEGVIARFAAESAINRPVTVDEVAALAEFLASDGSSGITGACLSVDGGIAHY